MRFTQKVVMITGGAGGIGAACAKRFEDMGAKVSVNDINDTEHPDCESYLFTRGDVRDDNVRQEFLFRTIETFGNVDILVNNAGVGIYAPASETDLQLARSMFEVNVFAALAMSQAVIPHFRRRNAGLVMNIASIGALVTLPWSTLYCASKYALYAISNGLRRELRGSGIQVVTVIPGIVATQFRNNVLSGEVPTRVARLRQTVSADHVADTVIRAAQRPQPFVYKPGVGRIFALVDRLLPWAMDRFIDRQWRAPNGVVNSDKEVRAVPR